MSADILADYGLDTPAAAPASRNILSDYKINEAAAPDSDNYDNPTWRDVAGGVLDLATPVLRMQQSPSTQALSDISGLGQAGRAIPFDIQSIAGLPGLAGEAVGRALSGAKPIPETQDVYDAMGTKRAPLNTLKGVVQMGSGFLLPYLGERAFVGRLLKPANFEDAALKLQAHHNSILEKLQQRFKYVANEMEKRGIRFGGSPLTTTKGAVTKNLLDKMEEAAGEAAMAKGLPRIKDAAALGNYSPLHDYQSALGMIERRHYQDPSTFHLGENIHEARDDLFKYMEDMLRNEGHGDLADQMKANRIDYAGFKKTFYPKKERALVKLFDPSTQEISSTTKNVFKKNNEITNRVLNQLPEVKKEIMRYYLQESLKSKNIFNKLKAFHKFTGPLGLASAVTGSGLSLYGLYSLINKISGGSSSGSPYSYPQQ